MTLRSKTSLLWSVLVIAVATASVAATIAVYHSGLFAPKDYEDCAEGAARNAKSKDALSILISVCRSKFEGRRKLGGGYTYYDSCTESTYDINGPNLTPDELKTFKRLCLRHLDVLAQIEAGEEESKRNKQQAAKEAMAKVQQAEARQYQAEQEAKAEANRRLQARKLAAMAAIHITPKGFKCWMGNTPCDKAGDKVDMEVEVTNRSREALSSVSIGLAFAPMKGSACPLSYAETKTLKVPLSPGETRLHIVDFLDTAFVKHPVCIKVLDAEFVDNQPTPQQIGSCQGAGGISLDLRIDGCTTLIESGPWSAQVQKWAHNSRGNAYYAKGDYDHALADYDQAIRFDPEYASAYYNRGTAYKAKGDYDHALADYDQTIRLDPKYAVAYFYRGIANIYAGALPNALANFSQASVLNPKNAYAALWLDIVGQRSNIPSQLSQAISTIDMTAWPAPVIRMFLGQMPPAAVLTAADDQDSTKKKGQVCEANFYSGEWALRKGDKNEAMRLFRLAASDCPKSFDEWTAANAELKAIGNGH
jgi:lipoprotein NlpI